MDPSLVQLVERARQGDASAFDAVVAAFETPLVRFIAGQLSGDVTAAHDVAQDVFLEAWRRLPRLDHAANLRAWLYRVAVRLAANWRRRRGPRGRPFADIDHRCRPDGPSPGSALVAPGAGPDGALARREEAPRLRALVDGMPPAYAAALTLHYLERMDMKETARVLGVRVATLKMRLCRGRSLLRERLLREERWDLRGRSAARGPAAPRAAPRGRVAEEAPPPAPEEPSP